MRARCWRSRARGRSRLRNRVAARGLSVRETEALVQRTGAGTGRAPQGQARDRDLARLEEEVSRAARHHRARSEPGARAAARIVVHYSSLDQLDQLLKKLR